jgi:hypothetical protein
LSYADETAPELGLITIQISAVPEAIARRRLVVLVLRPQARLALVSLFLALFLAPPPRLHAPFKLTPSLSHFSTKKRH